MLVNRAFARPAIALAPSLRQIPLQGANARIKGQHGGQNPGQQNQKPGQGGQQGGQENKPGQQNQQPGQGGQEKPGQQK